MVGGCTGGSANGQTPAGSAGGGAGGSDVAGHGPGANGGNVGTAGMSSVPSETRDAGGDVPAVTPDGGGNILDTGLGIGETRAPDPDYQFDTTISQVVLERYLSRSISFTQLLQDDITQPVNSMGVDPRDNIRMLVESNAPSS